MTAKQPGLKPLLLLAALSLSVLAGCADPWENPDALPYRLVPVREFAGPFVSADLDRDGRDELLHYGALHEPGVGSLIIETFGGRDIEQVNVDGAVLRPGVLDLDDDDPLEILLPFVRDDSLFILALDHEGRRLSTVCLANGEPRRTPDGLLPWMPTEVRFTMEDMDGDRQRELVTVIRTGFARAPRGVLVHSWPEGERMAEALVEAALAPESFRDYDSDGTREIVFSAYASNNGASAGGLDDRHHYVGAFSIAPAPRLRWYAELGGLRTSVSQSEGDLDGDGRIELLVAVRNVDTGQGRLEVRDPMSGRVRVTRTLASSEAKVARLQPEGPATPVVIQPDGTLLVLDGSLRTIERHQLPVRQVSPQGLTVAPDLDGDGADEVFIKGGKRTYWLDPHFRLRGSMAGALASPLYAQQGDGMLPLLVVGGRGPEEFLSIEPNPWYLVHRYGRAVGGLLALGLIGGGGGVLLRLRRRNRRLYGQNAELEAVLATSGEDGGFDERAWRLTARRVAHDLRNPLTSILLNTEHLRRTAATGGTEEEVARYAARIEERVEHLRRVTRNFLKFVDVEAPSLTDLDLAGWLRAQAETIQAGLPPDIALDVRTDGALPVRADAEQLASVVDNLAANAVNALPEGGRIVLSAYPARALQLGDDPAPRDWVVVEVRDSGVGIPAPLRERLFAPGVSGTEGGAGFGLAVVQKVVADHGGHIDVESEEGAGTVFSLYLPARTPATDRTEP